MPAPATYSAVLVEEGTGRIVRRVTGISESGAATLGKIFDAGLDTAITVGRIAKPVGDIVEAFAQLGRALEPLKPPRRLPTRRVRR